MRYLNQPQAIDPLRCTAKRTASLPAFREGFFAGTRTA